VLSNDFMTLHTCMGYITGIMDLFLCKAFRREISIIDYGHSWREASGGKSAELDFGLKAIEKTEIPSPPQPSLD
jgi:hypothetical protein